MLKPIEHYQEREASIAELEQLITPKTCFRFVEVWKEFKAKLQPGDQLVEFCTDKQSWEAMAGRAGYKIIRNGETVATLTALLN